MPGAKLGTSVLDLDVDESKLDKGLASGERKAGGFLDRLKGRFGGLGSEVKTGLSAGLGAAVGMTAVGAASEAIGRVASFLGDAKTAASDLNESVNATNVVFGTGAEKIHEYGRTASETAGLSARAFNQLVTPLGAMLQNVGFGADQAAESSIELTQRAADMASVFNTDVSDALAAIQAGLRGEADPLERFGVGLSAAAVTAKALEMGLADTAAELDDNAKMQARLALLMEQTDRVAGDFANTSDELANQTRITDARMENLMARVGQGLIPIFEGLGWVVGNVVLPGLEALVSVAGAVGDAIGLVGDVVGSVTEAMRSDAANAAIAWEESADEFKVQGQRYADGLSALVTATEEGVDGMASAAGEAPGEMADAMLANQFELTDAVSQLVNFMEQALSPAQERFNAQAFLASQELADGLASGIPSVRAKAEELRDEAIAKLAELDAYPYGAGVGDTFANGLSSRYGVVRDAAGNLAQAVRGQIGILSEPSDPTSPLRGITHWGANIVGAVADGMLGEMGTLERAFRAMDGVLASSVVPTVPMPLMAGLGAAVGAAGPSFADHVPSDGGVTIIHDEPHITVQLLDRMEVRSPRDIGDGLRILEERGYLDSRYVERRRRP